MKKKTAAAGIVLLLAILLWVGIHLTRVYETTVNGHNGPITVSVSTSGKKSQTWKYSMTAKPSGWANAPSP